MNNQELSEYVKQLGIAQDHILREEAEMSFLDDFSQDILSTKILFYGGTALRLAYNSPRFSEDIDLLCLENVEFSLFERFIQDVVRKHADQWSLRDIKEKRNTFFALISIKDERLKHAFSMKIELHRIIPEIPLQTELLLIKSPVSISAPLLLVPTLEELKRLKELALVSRKKARDIFDLWYIAQSLRQELVLPQEIPLYGEREFRNELQVFLPQKYYPVITQLYESIARKH